MNENKLVVDLDTCRITLASETEEKNHVELEVNEGMNGDKEWFKQQIVKKYPSQSEIDNPDYEIIAKVEIIDEALSLIDQIEPKTVESVISEFGELSVRKLTDKQLRVLLAVSSNMRVYCTAETKNRQERLYSEVPNV